MKTQIKKSSVTIYFLNKIILSADCPFRLLENSIPICHPLYRFEEIEEGTLIKYKDIDDKIGYMFWVGGYGFIECSDVYKFFNEASYHNYIEIESQLKKKEKSKEVVNDFLSFDLDSKKELYEFIYSQNPSNLSNMKNEHFIVTNNLIIVEMLSTCNIKRVTDYPLSNFVYKITDIKPYDILYYLNTDDKLERLFYCPKDRDFVSFDIIKKDLSGFSTEECKEIAIAFVKGNIDEEYNKIKRRKNFSEVFFNPIGVFKNVPLKDFKIDEIKLSDINTEQTPNNSFKYSLEDLGGSIQVIFDMCTIPNISCSNGIIRFNDLKNGDLFVYKLNSPDRTFIKFWGYSIYSDEKKFLDFNTKTIGFPIDWVLEDTKKYLSRMVNAWCNGRWREEKALIDTEIAESFKYKIDTQSHPTTSFITTFTDKIIIPRYSTTEFGSAKEYENKFEVKFKNLKDGDVLCFIKRDDINRGFWVQDDIERKEKIKLLHFQFWFENRFIDFTEKQIGRDIKWITPDNIPRMVKAFLSDSPSESKLWDEEKEKIKKETLLLFKDYVIIKEVPRSEEEPKYLTSKSNKYRYTHENKINEEKIKKETLKLFLSDFTGLTFRDLKKINKKVLEEIDKGNKNEEEIGFLSNLSIKDKDQLISLIEKIINNSKDTFNILEEGVYHGDWYIHVRRVKKKDKVIITIEKIKNIDVDDFE